jgi:hypothetical protein
MEDQMMSSEMSQHRRRQLQPTGSGGEGKFGKHSMQHTGGNAQDEWRKRMAEHTHTHTHNDHPTMMREESHRSDESHRKYTHTMLPTGSLGSNGKASETSDDANLSSKTQMIDNSSYNSGTHARSPHVRPRAASCTPCQPCAGAACMMKWDVHGGCAEAIGGVEWEQRRPRHGGGGVRGGNLQSPPALHAT